jgi:FkbM family methyltransferase
MQSLEVSVPTVLDIGANYGQSVENYLSLFPKAKIISFEPIPEMADLFEKTYGKNESVTLHRIALSDIEGILPFYKTRNQAASSLLPPEEFIMKLSVNHNYDYEILEIPVTTIDLLIRKKIIERPDIMKIDVQGGELAVLKGAESFLRNQDVLLIYLEITHAETYKNQSVFSELITFLTEMNYILWDLLPFVYTVTGRIWYSNALFLSSNASKKIEAQHREQTN